MSQSVRLLVSAALLLATGTGIAAASLLLGRLAR